MCRPDHLPPRRAFLRNSGLLGLGTAAALAAFPGTADAATTADTTTETADRGTADSENPRFTLAVMPDTPAAGA